MVISWRLVLNITLFQIGWFACLLLPLMYSLWVAIAIVIVHFSVLVPSIDWYSEVVLLVKVLLVGIMLEKLYLIFGVLITLDGSVLPPPWLLTIWVLFATTFRHGLFWLRERWWLSAFFAALAAPSSYFTGASLNETMALVSLLLSAYHGWRSAGQWFSHC